MPGDDPIPDGADETEADLLPDDPSDGLRPDDPAESLGPDDPSDGLAPETPTVPEFSADDAPGELKRQFWSLVLVFNVALFGMSLGAMLVGFEGRWRVGGAIFAVGAFAFARGWLGYRKVTGNSSDDGAPADETDDAGTRKD